MGKKTRRVILRVDENMFMRLDELCKKNGTGISVIARAFIAKVLNDITNTNGNLKTND